MSSSDDQNRYSELSGWQSRDYATLEPFARVSSDATPTGSDLVRRTTDGSDVHTCSSDSAEQSNARPNTESSPFMYTNKGDVSVIAS